MRFSNEDSGNIPSFETLQTPKLLLSFETKLQLRHMNYHKYKQQLPCFALSNDWKKKKKKEIEWEYSFFNTFLVLQHLLQILSSSLLQSCFK